MATVKSDETLRLTLPALSAFLEGNRSMTPLLQCSVPAPSAYVSIRSHLFLHHFPVRHGGYGGYFHWVPPGLIFSSHDE
jgi:hypothetical protein